MNIKRQARKDCNKYYNAAFGKNPRKKKKFIKLDKTSNPVNST